MESTRVSGWLVWTPLVLVGFPRDRQAKIQDHMSHQVRVEALPQTH